MPVPKSYKGLKAIYDGLDGDVKNYLGKLEPLLADPLNPYSFPSAGVPLEALRAAFPQGSSE